MWFTDWLAGDAVIVKSGGTGVVTTSVAVVECTIVPLVPVMVSVELPAGVEVSVVTDRVDDPEPATEVGLNVPVAPLGKPETLKLTVPVKPDVAVTVVVYDVPLPCTTV